MINLKIFINWCSNHFKVTIKDINNNIMYDNYLNYLGNIYLKLDKGIYKIFVNNFYRVFYYDGNIKKICFYFGYNHKLSRKFRLVDKFYNLPIEKGVINLWQEVIQ